MSSSDTIIFYLHQTRSSSNPVDNCHISFWSKKTISNYWYFVELILKSYEIFTISNLLKVNQANCWAKYFCIVVCIFKIVMLEKIRHLSKTYFLSKLWKENVVLSINPSQWPQRKVTRSSLCQYGNPFLQIRMCLLGIVVRHDRSMYLLLINQMN